VATDSEEINNLRRRLHDLSDVAQGLVTRDATMALQVSNLLSMFTEHKDDSKAFMGDAREKLAEINEQVTITNGRVNGHDREIRDMKETITWAIRLVIGLNVTVLGAVIVYWVTHR
jgi:CHASE3 domain sensor protein